MKNFLDGNLFAAAGQGRHESESDEFLNVDKFHDYGIDEGFTSGAKDF